ncbi:MAG TPA: hypothetical protein VHU83_02715 [Bryobacteraceae bacterium]|jgi:TolB protein|nr:hypothetical protein [Bryobacteraceae bacterium]
MTKITKLAAYSSAAAVAAFAIAGAAAHHALPNSERHFALVRLTEDPAGGGDSAISPDGRYFLASSKRTKSWQVYRFDIEAKRWTQITHGAGDNFEAQWAPDQKRIAYTSTRAGNKDIFVFDLAQKTERQLTTSREDDEYPNWSPDGNQIVYTGGKWEQRDFFLIAPQGGTPRPVTGKLSKAGACSFMPNGRFLLCHTYDGGTGNVILLPVQPGPQLDLTSGTQVWDYKPTASPSGEWMAFSRAMDGPSAIWLQPYPTGTAFPLTNGKNDDRWPTWSKSGDRLLFHRYVDQGCGLKILDRQTRTVRTVVGSEEAPQIASFNPAGDAIVYGATIGERQVLRIKYLSTGKTETVPTGGLEASYPAWSKDGKQIAFASRSADRWDITTVRSDGSGLHTWTDRIPNLRAMAGPIDWSPDSRKLVFHAASLPFEANLFVLDITTGKLQNITDDHWFSEAPTWTPDGQSLVFMSTRGGDWTWGFFRLSLADKKFEGLTAPDYVEKNYPRFERSGALLLTIHGEDDAEYLAEKPPNGSIQVIAEAGAWSRWPSLSSNERYILYTQITHRVEYWLAENITAPDSPIFAKHSESAATPMPSANRDASSYQASTRATSAPHSDIGTESSTPNPFSSPNRMHHR